MEKKTRICTKKICSLFIALEVLILTVAILWISHVTAGKGYGVIIIHWKHTFHAGQRRSPQILTVGRKDSLQSCLLNSVSLYSLPQLWADVLSSLLP